MQILLSGDTTRMQFTFFQSSDCHFGWEQAVVTFVLRQCSDLSNLEGAWALPENISGKGGPAPDIDTGDVLFS